MGSLVDNSVQAGFGSAMPSAIWTTEDPNKPRGGRSWGFQLNMPPWAIGSIFNDASSLGTTGA